jgi:hypothetical protein
MARDGRRKSKRLAKLTPLEDKSWVSAFCYYLDDGKSDGVADRLAWKDMLSEFPRLRFYNGCES